MRSTWNKLLSPICNQRRRQMAVLLVACFHPPIQDRQRKRNEQQSLIQSQNLSIQQGRRATESSSFKRRTSTSIFGSWRNIIPGILKIPASTHWLEHWLDLCWLYRGIGPEALAGKATAANSLHLLGTGNRGKRTWNHCGKPGKEEEKLVVKSPGQRNVRGQDASCSPPVSYAATLHSSYTNW